MPIFVVALLAEIKCLFLKANTFIMDIYGHTYMIMKQKLVYIRASDRNNESIIHIFYLLLLCRQI